MDFLKGFKDLVFEEDKASKTTDTKATETQNSLPYTPEVISPIKTTPIDTDIQKTLDDAILMEKQKSSGFDYCDFKNLLLKLNETITDERTRYQSANAMALTMGITSQVLIESANKYLSILQNEEQNFKNALQTQFNDTVIKNEEEIKHKDEQIKNMSEQINQITIQINELQTQKQAITNTIVDNKGKIEKTQNAFYSTYQNFLGKIQKDIEKINLYLGETNA